MYNWDYDLPKNWKPKTPEEWEWYLIRKINYGQFKDLKRATVKSYLEKIKKYLDPGKRLMLEDFFQHD